MSGARSSVSVPSARLAASRWPGFDADLRRDGCRLGGSAILGLRIGGGLRRERLCDLRLVGQVASEQGLERDHGVPDLLQLVDRGLLIRGRRFGLPVVEVARGRDHLSPAAVAQSLQERDALLELLRITLRDACAPQPRLLRGRQLGLDLLLERGNLLAGAHLAAASARRRRRPARST